MSNDGRTGNEGNQDPLDRSRQESVPFNYDELTERQRKACEDAFDVMVGMVLNADREEDKRLDDESSPATAWPKRPFSFMPRIQRDRHSRVLLIDGDRGTGKTAVLLSILDVLDRTSRLRHHKFSESRETATTETAKVNGFTLGKKRGVLERVVLLNIVGMESLPMERSIVFQLVQGFGKLVEALETKNLEHGMSTAHSLAEPWSHKQSRLLAAWRELFDALALGWSTDIRARRANLDAQRYVDEFAQAEKKQPATPELFFKLVEELTTAFKSRFFPPGLFVVVLDDADMNPERSRSLVEALRVFWHPRVLFLLTGDSRLFQDTLRNAYLGQLREPLRGVAPPQLAVFKDDEVRAVDLADAVMLKVFPLPQRLSLEPLSSTEQIYHSGINRLPELATLLRVAPYTIRALPPTMRAIVDLAVLIERVPTTNASPSTDNRARRKALAELIRRIWDDAVAAGRHLLSEEQGERLVGSVTVAEEQLTEALVSSGAGVGQDISALLPFSSLLNLEAGFPFLKRRYLASRQLLEIGAPDVQIHVTTHVEFGLHTGTDENPHTARQLRRLDAAAIWIHTVGCRGSAVAQTSASEYMSDSARLVRTRHRDPETNKEYFIGWSRYISERMVDHLWQIDYWQRLCSKISEQSDRLTRAFLAMSTTIPSLSCWASSTQDEIPSWFELLTTIQSILKSPDAPHNFILWVRERLPLLAAPEYGLPEAVAEDVLCLFYFASRRSNDPAAFSGFKRIMIERLRRMDQFPSAIQQRALSASQSIFNSLHQTNQIQRKSIKSENGEEDNNFHSPRARRRYLQWRIRHYLSRLTLPCNWGGKTSIPGDTYFIHNSFEHLLRTSTLRSQYDIALVRSVLTFKWAAWQENITSTDIIKHWVRELTTTEQSWTPEDAITTKYDNIIGEIHAQNVAGVIVRGTRTLAFLNIHERLKKDPHQSSDSGEPDLSDIAIRVLIANLDDQRPISRRPLYHFLGCQCEGDGVLSTLPISGYLRSFDRWWVQEQWNASLAKVDFTATNEEASAKAVVGRFSSMVDILTVALLPRTERLGPYSPPVTSTVGGTILRLRTCLEEQRTLEGEGHASYARALEEWLYALAMFAAPESGAPISFARDLLAILQYSSNERSAALALRTSRAKFLAPPGGEVVKASEENVADFFRLTRQSFPDHPWYQSMEPLIPPASEELPPKDSDSIAEQEITIPTLDPKERNDLTQSPPKTKPKKSAKTTSIKRSPKS